MNRESGLHRRIAIAAQRDDAVDEVCLLFGEREGIPAELIGSGGRFEEGTAADEARGNFLVGAVGDGGADAVGPGAASEVTRRSKGRAPELFGVESEGMFLRRILADVQASGDGFGGEP